MKLPVIVLGGGGHAKVCIEALLGKSIDIIGFTDPYPDNKSILGVKCIGTDEDIYKYSTPIIRLINGLGSIGQDSRRIEIFEEFKARGYHFGNVVHPSAVVASDVELSEGVQIMAGAVVQPGCRIGNNVILNTRVSVDHDCHIGSHVHLAPGVTVSGGVKVGDMVHVGPGATIIQYVTVGQCSTIGAGALVLRDVPEGVTATGVPATGVPAKPL